MKISRWILSLLVALAIGTDLCAESQQKTLAKEVTINAEMVEKGQYVKTMKLSDPVFTIDGDVDKDAYPQPLVFAIEDDKTDILLLDGETGDIEPVGVGTAIVYVDSYDAAATAVLTVTVIADDDVLSAN